MADPAHTVSCMDSWARAQGLATYSEMRDALRDLLDLWHGGHLQVRQEALGAWNAAVQIGENAIANGTAGVPACATEQDCEWQPWCRMHANCRKKIEAERTAKHVALGVALRQTTEEKP